MQIDYNALLGKLIDQAPSIIAAVCSGLAVIVGAYAAWKATQAKWKAESAEGHSIEAAKDSKIAVAQNSAAVVRREEIASDIKDLKETRSAELMAVATQDAQDVLLIDDTEHAIFERVLVRKGMTVGCFDNGKAALEWLKTHHVKLIITDLALVGLDGWSIIEQFRFQFPERAEKIAVLTGHASPQDAELAARYNVVKILDKNLGFEVVANEIQSILGSV